MMWTLLAIAFGTLGAYALLTLRPFDAMFWFVLAGLLVLNSRRRKRPSES